MREQLPGPLMKISGYDTITRWMRIHEVPLRRCHGLPSAQKETFVLPMPSSCTRGSAPQFPRPRSDLRQVIRMCQHIPQCPSAEAAEACNARVCTSHPEQGWYLLCNGVVVFDDGGAI